MDEKTAEIGQLVAKVPSRLATPRRLARKMRDDWHTLGRLAKKARARVQSAQGLQNKFGEIGWIFGKAQDRIARRLGLPGSAVPLPQTDETRRAVLTAQRTAISALLPGSCPVPACVAVGGGAFLVALGTRNTVSAWIRDAHSNLHETNVTAWEGVSLEKTAVQFLIQAPVEIISEESAPFDLIVRTGDEHLVFENITVENRAALSIRDFRFENGCVSFSGNRSGDIHDEYSIGLFVDGNLSASCAITPRNDVFSGTIVLDRSHLDGGLHQLELRELPYMALLASSCQIAPFHMTPWSALQLYARPPLDGTLSQQARHHFRSYQHWFERLRNAGNDSVPPLEILWTELQQGFRKRPEYPRIAFRLQDKPTVSIVIPVHNKFEVTYFCLCSILFAYNDTSFEVILVDDGSVDETCRIKDFVDGVRVVRRDKSLGFVRSCNAGAALARGEFIAILNNDTEVTAFWLDELVATFRNFDGVGLVGSKLVYPDGRLQEAGGVIWGSGNPWNVGRDCSAEDPRFSYVRKVDYVSGASLLIERHLWQRVGGFSEEFAPAYFEDTDLSMKVRETGLAVVYAPGSVVYHFEGQTSGTNVASGAKAFQEINRPKFRKKWAHAYRGHGREGEAVDREKDRAASFRVLFIDHQVPFVDLDAGSYAAFQEIRLLQHLGAKVTFLPRNLAWMDRHTTALQRIGVECLYAPFVRSFLEYIRAHAAEYDLVFVSRYKIAEQVLPLVRSAAPRTRIAFNLADLHFLREFREATAKTPGYSFGKADETRRAELAAIMQSDVTFSYSDVEIDVIRDLVPETTKLARAPWVVACRKRELPYSETRDIMFLGGFNHPPNVQAAKFFARTVMPLLHDRLPGALFNIIGSEARLAVPELVSESVRVLGYVPSLSEHLDRARVFVAPLLAGAGLKGKVIDAISHATPCVLSPVAAEGTGLTDGVDCLIANSPEEWADRVARLYTDESLWNRISANAFELARSRYSFELGTATLLAGLAAVGISAGESVGLTYRHARPDRYRT